MEITEIETIAAGEWLFVRVHTDEGITGLGESGTWGYLEASAAVIETFERYLVGEDPLKIEHHWNYLYRNAHFRGAAIMGALSGIDIALWDIAGKHFDVPAYQLLGGPTRKKARAYARIIGRTGDQLVERSLMAVDEGFTAVGHLNPFLDEPREESFSETYSGRLAAGVDRVQRVREAVGDDVDLCIEIHRRLDPAEAVTFGREIEPYRPMFYEDPIRPDSFDAMAEIGDKLGVPIATGERLHTVHEFETLLSRDAVQFVRPDVCMAGGLTGVKKIASLAEAYYANVVPHNPLSPVSTAACLQLAACIPNFAIQEYPYRPDKGEPAVDLVDNPAQFDDGYLYVPDRPGIGVELDDDTVAECPYEPREVVTRLHEDGSVVDS